MRFISHEVRTPLNSVVMGARLVQDDMIRFDSNGSGGGIAGTEKNPVLSDKLSDWSGLAGGILTNAQSAVDVLNDLLNYDKVESRTLKLELTYVPIWALIKRTASEFQIAARAKSIDIKVDFSKLSEVPKLESAPKSDTELGKDECPLAVNDLWVVGDTARLSEFFRNILSNAVKFTPEGGKTIP